MDLCLVWIDDGMALEQLTRKIERLNFAGKLAQLGEHLHRKESKGSRDAYEDWLVRVHKVRERRNVLVHGRLGVDVRRGTLTVMISRATSPSLESVEFDLAQRDEL